MNLASVITGLTLAVIFSVHFGACASAQDASAPVPDKGTTGQNACIDDNSHYATHNNIATFVVQLTNKCDKRLRCRVFVYEVGAKGPSSGRTTMILGPKSGGVAASKNYAMRVKVNGGDAHVARECSVF